MNLIEMLTRSVGTQHEVIAWFPFGGKQFAGRYITDAVHIDRAREYMLRAVENTRGMLEWHKAHGNYNWPGVPPESRDQDDFPMLCEHATGEAIVILKSDYWT